MMQLNKHQHTSTKKNKKSTKTNKYKESTKPSASNLNMAKLEEIEAVRRVSLVLLKQLEN